MSHLQYFSYPGFGDHVREHTWYSQAVRVSSKDQIHCSGQGGWDRATRNIPDSTIEQIDRAFDNVEHTVRAAGAQGWKDIYSVRLYHASLDDNELQHFVKKLKEYCPGHQPILTGIEVKRLAFDMKVEMEVSAYLEESK